MWDSDTTFWLEILKLVGGAGGIISLLLFGLQRGKLQSEITATVQKTYSATVEDLQKDIDRLKEKIIEMEANEQKCTQRNIELKAEIKDLVNKNEGLLRTQQKLRNEINNLKRRLQRYEKRT